MSDDHMGSITVTCDCCGSRNFEPCKDWCRWRALFHKLYEQNRLREELRKQIEILPEIFKSGG